jgi:hypothetical protein
MRRRNGMTHNTGSAAVQHHAKMAVRYVVVVVVLFKASFDAGLVPMLGRSENKYAMQCHVCCAASAAYETRNAAARAAMNPAFDARQQTFLSNAATCH